jgi:hypothetical protein
MKKTIFFMLAMVLLWSSNAFAQRRIKTTSVEVSLYGGTLAMYGNQKPNLLSWRTGMDVRYNFNPMISIGIGGSYDHIRGPRKETNTYGNLVGFSLNSVNVYSTLRLNLNQMSGGSSSSDLKLFVGAGGGVRMSLANDPYDLTGDKIVWSSKGQKYSFGIVEAGGSYHLSPNISLGLLFQGQTYRGEDDLPNSVFTTSINERDGRTFVFNGSLSITYTFSERLYGKNSRPKSRGRGKSIKPLFN